MTETLVVRMLDEHDGLYEWLIPDTAIEPTRGSLTELKETSGQAEVIFLLPAPDVLLLELDLPIKSASKLNKALPFALEDYLADELETYHWVWHRQSTGKLAVAVIAHQCLHRHLQPFDNVGIKLQAVYAETTWLPVEPESLTVALDQQHALLRYGIGQGGGVDLAGLAVLINKWHTEHPNQTRVQLWHTDDISLAWPEAITVESKRVSSLLPLLCARRQPILNLLTGPYQTNSHTRIRWQAWLPAMVLMLLAVLIQYGLAIYHYRQAEQQLTALEAANRQVFSQAFPDIKRIVNLKAQAEQGLAALKKQQGSGGSQFLRLLQSSGEQLIQDPQLHLEAVEFSNDSLNLQLTGNSIAQLEQFKQRLEQKPEMSVHIQSAETGSKGLSAHVQINERH